MPGKRKRGGGFMGRGAGGVAFFFSALRSSSSHITCHLQLSPDLRSKCEWEQPRTGQARRGKLLLSCFFLFLRGGSKVHQPWTLRGVGCEGGEKKREESNGGQGIRAAILGPGACLRSSTCLPPSFLV
ncbi:hypothetical protein LX36DRAFT_491980 [Colletotrichum falcatum]|nr:hypothetical protein LX36DRAFT_491980 [Colletotrichum falcatum]